MSWAGSDEFAVTPSNVNVRCGQLCPGLYRTTQKYIDPETVHFTLEVCSFPVNSDPFPSSFLQNKLNIKIYRTIICLSCYVGVKLGHSL